MSGTKFKVKEYSQHQDSQGVLYEYGAEVTKEFPIVFGEVVSPSSGTYDRMSVYGQLRVVNEDVHLDGGGTLRSDYARIDDLTVFSDASVGGDTTVSGTLTAGSAIVSGALTAESYAVSGTITTGSAIVSGTLTAGSAIVGVLTSTEEVASFDTKSVTISPSTDSDDLPTRLRLLRTNPMGSSTVELLAEDTNSDRYGIRLSFEGASSEDVGVSTFNGALQAVREVSGAVEPISNVISFSNTGGNVQVASSTDIGLTAQATLTMDATGEASIASGEQITVGDGNSPITIQSGTNDLYLYGGSTRIVAGQGGHGVISASTISLVAPSDSVTLSGTTVEMFAASGATSLELSDSTLELSNSSGASDPVGLSISKPVHGTAYLELKEGVYGARLVYQGDTVDEDLGTSGDNFVALQALASSSTTHNVLQYSYGGGQVSLDSQSSLSLSSGDGDDLTITAPGSGGNIRLHAGTTNSETGTIHFSTGNNGNQLEIDGNGVVKILGGNLVLEGTPTDTGTLFTSYYLGRTSSGIVYKSTASFFTGTHIYLSDSEIPAGASVELSSNDTVEVTASALSAKVCGIVVNTAQVDSESLPEIERVSTRRLTEEDIGKWLIKVAALGDSRDSNCQGFNICNENGEVQAGDLLVTSSTPGYLMKQDDDIIRSCTVGKAMEDVVFNEGGQATGVYGYIYCG